jgi:molecular chaperone DnaK
VHPDEVVALGAAIQGAALLDAEQDVVLLDVTPHTLGLMVVGGYFEELIPQNCTVPTSRSKIFTTIRDNQTAVKILVMQGESKRADENELLGEFVLTGLRRAPAGQVEIEVTFEINADGIVSVNAKDLETGKAQSITVTAASGLTKEELDTMVEEAKGYAVARRGDETTEKARQEVETSVSEIQKLLPKVEEVVAGSDFGRDAIEKARAMLERARVVLKEGDAKALKEQHEGLQRTLRMFKGVVGKV